ncbi:SCP2 sterol-binding domain-containing protein [Desulfosporosinus sp.]|uniref:SCP2 sterol-binding domain-containing protein n=1 Tax=Desulfosporosinus sp. TaxID=157907 RepID=UPI000E9FCBAE|nr:SCP2 sterol-binding domain-containing protein [Desulfosporosinus sp.]MBC2727454.1 SCP2 sterol-binding domain-containing protein [Desulfosporosinus sp.]HBV86043.1 sterol carrier protein [Desulfosporosinus sp.]
MTVRDELLALVEKMNTNPEHIASEKDRIFQIDLEESGPLQIVFKAGQVEIVEGTSPDAEVTLILNEKNFSKLLQNKLNTTMAFMTGGLKVEGKLGLALKLQEIVKAYQ